MSTPSAIAPPSNIGLIGLGNMGVPMGACLVRAGFSVTGFDLAQVARDRFLGVGGKVATDVKTTVADARVVITLLPDGRAVRAVMDSIRPHLRANAIVVDMSSSDPIGTRQLGEELVAAGLEFADAPVSGGVKRAVDGTLAIMAGGSAATLDRLQLVLGAMGRSIFRTGAIGTGHAMKALNNYLSAAGLVATVEAILIGQRFGLDPLLMTDIFNASTGRNNTTEVKLKPFILSGAYNAGFPLKLMAKDVRTADDLAHSIGVPAPLADICAQLWDDAASALDDTADHTEMRRYIEGLAGRLPRT